MDLLENADTAVLGKWLSLYVVETRKQDGGRYPPKSVCMLLTDFFVIICALLSRALSQLLGTIYNGPALPQPYSAPPVLRQYERTTLGQQQAVSRILSSTEGTTFQKPLSLQTTSRVIPAQPPHVPQMKFSSCIVTIYNGPALPPPYSVPPPLALPSSSELDLTDVDFDEFNLFMVAFLPFYYIC